jgi:DNA relaxase NicK
MNTINVLMDKFAKDHNDEDVEEIIKYVRKQLSNYDAGIKPERSDVAQVDMSAILSNITKRAAPAPAKPAPKGGSFRRM